MNMNLTFYTGPKGPKVYQDPIDGHQYRGEFSKKSIIVHLAQAVDSFCCFGGKMLQETF